MEAAAAAPPPSTAAAAPLPFLGDDIFVLIAAELDARMLGRLGCAAQRFWRPSVPDPAHKADDPAPPELWSVAEEGARRRLCAQSEQVRGWVCRGGVGGSWLRALGEAEKLQRPLAFTAHHETINLSEEGAVAARVVDLLSWGGAVCGGHEMRRGRHYATFTLRSMSYSIRPSTPSGIMFGVVGPTFNPTSDELAHRSSPAWMMYTDTGNLWCCREEPAENDSGWEGQPTTGELKEGDVVVRPGPPPLFLCRPLHRCVWPVWRRACCSTSTRQPSRCGSTASGRASWSGSA
eukprot:COSAG04_NODE_997_length_8867_cov_22.280908_4_plen_291_part_00